MTGKDCPENTQQARPKFVAYTRVSTRNQPYGCERQQKAIVEYINSQKGVLIASFSEKASGVKNDRSELNKAIACCIANSANIVVEDISRLSRNKNFVIDTNLKLSQYGLQIIDLHLLKLPSWQKINLEKMADIFLTADDMEKMFNHRV